MCIIVIKKKGVALPDRATLKQCFNSNPDGAGFMYVKDNKVVIDKGYMSFRPFYKALKQLPDVNIIMHFRIGTQGQNDAKTTHPYPVTHNTDLMQKLQVECKLAFVHNGIIAGQKDYTRPDLNDTQIFNRDMLSILYNVNRTFYQVPRVKDWLEDATNSKLAFLDSKDNIFTVGNFIEDEGVLYSNSTYVVYKSDYHNYAEKSCMTQQEYLDNYYKYDYDIGTDLDKIRLGYWLDTPGGVVEVRDELYIDPLDYSVFDKYGNEVYTGVIVYDEYFEEVVY